jgi:histidinol-phosphate/aromatic aminotransferase/cobyric acid decarboxylase-like protein
VLDAAEWQAFLDALPAGCVVAADEAYVDYMDPGRRIRREDDVAAGRPLVVLRTFSKIYGLAGLRLGYTLASPALVPYLNAAQEPFKNVNRPARGESAGGSAGGAQSRTRPRAMTIRWMSEVPSSISSSFASRIHFSTGCSRE